MTVIKWIGAFIGVLVLAVAALFIGARFHDGPLGMIPGGPFTSGEWVEQPVTEWAFVADLDTIEMELEDATTSRTTWIASTGDHAYIPASLKFPPGKTWYLDAAKNGRAVLRIDGMLYPVMLRKLEDPAAIQRAGAVIREKYSPPPGGADDVWIFEVGSRSR
jgi:hypothetical protein